MDEKILIINPNSDPNMTKDIQKSADGFSQGDFEVECLSTLGAPKFIETYQDQKDAAPGMISLVKQYREKWDAFIVACHCDPNLDLIKGITNKPVVGIGEASMKIASILGTSFSVIQTSQYSVSMKEQLVQKYHLQSSLASVRAPEDEMKDWSKEKKYLETARAAVKTDGADAIVLGCAGMTGLDDLIQKELGVWVLDGVVCALILAAGLVKSKQS
ncbi:MAG: Asp/Glu/hydantoin racemase [Candidatus Aminicenantes bacterium]|nr:Asp/Glu/hydantoin racemase [Candidatus Aminicenantes bacterium]